MAIVFAFMIPVDGWLTKLSAPIVVYRDADTQRLRPVWDILAEEFAYAFALLTLVILAWDRARRRRDRGDRTRPLAARRVGFVRRHGGRQLRHAPVGHARLRDGLAPQPPRAGRRPVRAQRPVPAVLLGGRRRPLRLATVGPRVDALFWVGVGVTAYGAAYLFVHEVYIHRRLPLPLPSGRYLEWLRDAHRSTTATGGEPYGMLLPLVPARRPGGRPASRRGRARPGQPVAASTRSAPQPVVALDRDERQVDREAVGDHHDHGRPTGSTARTAGRPPRPASGRARPGGSRRRTARGRRARRPATPLADAAGEQRAGLGEAVLPAPDAEHPLVEPPARSKRRRAEQPAVASRRAAGSRWTA